MNGDPRTRYSLRWSFQWKEFVTNRYDVNLLGKSLKWKEVFNIKVCRAGYPIIFSEVPDLIK